MSLDTKIDLSIVSTLVNNLDLNASGRVFLQYATSLTLSNGVLANQADQLWFDTRQIAASGNDDLDVAGGLTNGLNQTVTLARIKGIYVSAAASNVNNVHIGGGVNPVLNWVAAAGDIVVVRPGGSISLWAPDAVAYAVTAATADILRITNSGAGSAVDYSIILVGSTV